MDHQGPFIYDAKKERGYLRADIVDWGRGRVIFEAFVANVIYAFTIRGNLTVPEVKRDVAKAIKLAVEHFEKYL